MSPQNTRYTPRKKVALFFSPISIFPAFSGNRQRIVQVASLFKRAGYETHILLPASESSDHEQNLWDSVTFLKVKPVWSPSRKLVQYDAWHRESLSDELLTAVSRLRPELILWNYIFHSRALETLPANILKIVDTHDIFAERNQRISPPLLASGFFSCTRADEERYLSRFDCAVAINKQDEAVFNTYNSDTRVFTIPYAPVVDSLVESEILYDSDEPTLLTVMSSNDVNLQSLRLLLARLTKSRTRKSRFKLTIVGDIGRIHNLLRLWPWPVLAWRWARFVGRVNKLERYYKSHHIVLVPIHSATGSSIKFAEAIFMGKPVMSTAEGSRGFSTNYWSHSFKSVSDLARALEGLEVRKINEIRDASIELSRKIRADSISGWNELEAFLDEMTSRDDS